MVSPARLKNVPRSPAKFRERELARALRAARRAGGVACVELLPDGRINIILGETSRQQDSAEKILDQL
jgi:hypothetical protein